MYNGKLAEEIELDHLGCRLLKGVVRIVRE